MSSQPKNSSKQRRNRRSNKNNAKHVVAQSVPKPQMAQQQLFHEMSKYRPESVFAPSKHMLQTTIDSLVENSVYKDCANTFLNPGHEGNTQHAMPIPDGSPGDVYLHKSIVSGSLNIPVGNGATQIQIALLPFAECPMAVRFMGGKWMAVSDTQYVTPNNAISLPCNFHHKVGVYSHRLIGKSVTLINESPEIYRSGNITSCRMPALVDTNSTASLHTYPVATGANLRVVQSMPMSPNELTTNLNASNWRSAEGSYLVSRPSLKWTDRNYPWDKTNATYDNLTPAVPATNASDNLSITDYSGTSYPVYSAGTGYGTDGDYTANMTATYSTMVGPPDGSDVVTSIIDGLNTAAGVTFRFKLCIVREFTLKNTSPLLRMAVPRPLRSDAFTEALLNYSTMIPGIYPASFNFWNELWRGFKKILGSISDKLPALTNMFAPMLPPNARAALDAVGKVNDAGRMILGRL